MRDLCGFYGFDGAIEDIYKEDETEEVSGYQILGAGPPARRNPQPQPRGKGPGKGGISFKPTKVTFKMAELMKKHPYFSAPFAARAGKMAEKAGNRAIRLSRPKKDFKKVTIRGIYGDDTIIGVAGRPPIVTKMSPKVKNAAILYNRSVDRAEKARIEAKNAGLRAKAVAKKVADDVKNASGLVKAMMAKQTKMHGLSDESVGYNITPEDVVAYCHMTGDDYDVICGQLEENDIVVHGYDPAAFSDYTPELAAAHSVLMGAEEDLSKMDENGLLPGEEGYTKPMEESEPDPETPKKTEGKGPDNLGEVIHKVPPDGVPYTGQRLWPRLKFGSHYYFANPAPTGSEWGWVWGWNKANAPHNNMSPRWICLFGKGDNPFGNPQNWDDFITPVTDPSRVSDKSIEGKKVDSKVVAPDGSFGPLIGDPYDDDFKNLRWATEDKKWFWYLEQAPEYATETARYTAAKMIEAEKAADAVKEAANKKAREAVEAANKVTKDAADFAIQLAEDASKAQDVIDTREREKKAADVDLDLIKSEAERKEREEEDKRVKARADADQEREDKKNEADQARRDAELYAEEVKAQREADAQDRAAYLAAMAAQMEIEKEQASIDLQRQRDQAAYDAANPQAPQQPQYEDEGGEMFDEGGGGGGEMFDEGGGGMFDEGGGMFDVTDL